MGQGLLVVISGPSGVGKGTVCAALCQRVENINISISATTRKARAGEVDGVDYLFVDRDRFREMIAQDELLEWAQVYRHFYGTPRDAVARLRENGRDVLLEIDVQGALQIKEKVPEAVLIFVYPPSLDKLEQRLRQRGTDTEEQILTRLNWSQKELGTVRQYDYVVVNDQVENAAAKIQSIIVAEKCRPNYLEN